jgi:hypothetical protein
MIEYFYNLFWDQETFTATAIVVVVAVLIFVMFHHSTDVPNG